jgi:hypothetical protein
MKNLLVYGAQFFGEKYMIEHFTKKIIEYSLAAINSINSVSILNYTYYFTQIILFLLYILIILNGIITV